MGLLQILNGDQDIKFYGGGVFPNPNSVSSTVTFGQKLIGYKKPPGTYQSGAYLPKSDQPYITTPIPDLGVSFKDQNPSLITLPGWEDGLPGIEQLNNLSNKIRYNSNSWGQDFLNRGNLYGLVRSKDDIKRLTSYFLDGTKGLLFIAKQNLLSRVGVQTEAPRNAGNALGFFNDGVYLPTSTLAQSAISNIGGHVLKQGIDPTGKIPGLKLSKYEDANNKKTKRNRLVKILGKFSDFPRSGNINKKIIKQYRGGPGSKLGIGSTKINYATDSEGKNKINSLVSKKFLNEKFGNFLTWDNNDFDRVSISNGYSNRKVDDKNSEILDDFRKKLTEPNGDPIKRSTFLSLSSNYRNFNIEKRLHYRSGGEKGNILDYTKGKRDNQGALLSSDLINMSSIYKSETPSPKPQLKDIIDFRIGIFDNKSIGETPEILKNWLHFRALLDKFSEGYKASWKGQDYMGRAEKFYKYNSFDRDINLSFNLSAFSKQELMPIYKKLNYLASHLAPYYSKEGYMSGNLVQLTVGNYLWEQPGFIESLSIDIDDSTPWEINLGLDGKEENGEINVKQVPHRIKVSMKFTPIHRFRPQIQELNGGNLDPTKPQFNQDNNGFGPQRYIALQDNKGDTNNGYNQQFAVSSPTPPTPATTNENQIFVGDTAVGSTFLSSPENLVQQQFVNENPTVGGQNLTPVINSDGSFLQGSNSLIYP